MEGIDQDATVGARSAFDDSRGLAQIPRIGPGHELEARAEAVPAGEVAQGGEGIDEATFFRVVAGDQQFPRTQPRRRRDCRLVVRDPGLGLEAKDLRIERTPAEAFNELLRRADQSSVATTS